MTAADLKETAKKLLAYVEVSSPTLTDRQLADYYLADQDVYKKAVESLPREKRLDSDGNQLSESELYNNTVESIDPSQLTYSDDEKERNLPL